MESKADVQMRLTAIGCVWSNECDECIESLGYGRAAHLMHVEIEDHNLARGAALDDVLCRDLPRAHHQIHVRYFHQCAKA